MDNEEESLSTPLLSLSSQTDDDAAAQPAAPGVKTDEGNRIRGRKELKTSLDDALRRVRDSCNEAVVSTFLVVLLLSFSIGLTVGIIPEFLTDRFARLDHGYGSTMPCWKHTIATMPEACIEGADDAQTGSAYGTFVQNLLTFFFNAVLGSYSDEHGRKGPLRMSIFLNALVPVSVVALQLCPDLNPIWYYAINAATGFISLPSIVFAMLSDGCPAEHRATRFATNMAGFYVGFAVAPAVGSNMSHIVASWWSLWLGVAALVVSMVCLPETVQRNNDDDDHNSRTNHPPSSALPRGDDDVTDDRVDAVAAPQHTSRNCQTASLDLLLRPFREMTILARNSGLVLVAVASFLQAAVYNTDASLLLFYIEEHLNVREDDIAGMFFCMGLMGAILSGIGMRPLVSLLGEQGLLVLTYVSGTIHNLIYGVATNKAEVTLALILSQFTKLGYPLVSSMASQKVGTDEQGRVQGALLALNALAGAVGPVAMNWVYIHTQSGNHKYLGPGMMFVLAAGLYLVGTVVVGRIYGISTVADDAGETNDRFDSDHDEDRAGTIGGNDDSLETPLLDESPSRESRTI